MFARQRASDFRPRECETTSSMLRPQTLILLYTDPGTGTLIWQLILAALFGGLFYVRRLRDRLVLRRGLRSGRDAETGDADAPTRAEPPRP